ncbi:MAG TPA: GNAT family N-acetyltransferase [Rhizomicrobium sp.]|nr:GNAT family N-acetyltransferase [Rhizomicrobium sp.]
MVADAATAHAVLWAGRDEIPLASNFDNDTRRDWVRDQCRNREVWLAKIGKQTAGIMVMQVDEIRYLVTLPAFRRHGVGRRFVRHAVAEIARRYQSGVYAKVRPENVAILSLLKVEGFKPDPILIAASGWVVYSIGNVG